MQFLKIFALVLSVAGALCILGFCIGSRKPFKYIFINFLIGAAALAAVNLTARFTGIRIPINPYSACAGSVFSLPGVCGLLFLRLIM